MQYSRLVIAGILVYGFTFSVQSAELQVPGGYPTIQAAIDAAVTGDEVILASQTYTGAGNRDLDFGGKAITVRSAAPEDPAVVAATVIDCQGSAVDLHRGFYFHNGEGNDSVIDGISITNGYAAGSYPANVGGGILCDNGASPTITRCRIYNCTATNVGGGIYCDSGSAQIAFCVIYDNHCEGDGGGIGHGYGSLVISHCTLTGNTAVSYGAGISIYGSSARVSSCVLEDNEAGYRGGGISIFQTSQAIIENCLIWNNRAMEGAGIMCYFSDSPAIKQCILSANQASNNGGGIFCLSQSSPDISNCLFTGNLSSASSGGAIDCSTSSNAAVTNCTLAGNQAATYGGGMHSYDSQHTLKNCIFWGNGAPAGSEIALTDATHPSTLMVSYSNIQGGFASSYIDTGNTLTWGSGNINQDPNFLALGFWDDKGTPGDATDDEWIGGDYHLTGMSPCIDAGDPSYLPTQGETDVGGIVRIINQVVDMGAYETDRIEITKMTCKAGKTRSAQADGCTLIGSWDPNDADLQQADTIHVIIGPYEETLDPGLFRQSGSKPKYQYKKKGAGISQMKLDLTKHTFHVTAKNVDLTGLQAPVPVTLILGAKYFVGVAYDAHPGDVINGTKSLQFQFMHGVQNRLRIDTAKFKGKNNIGVLTVQGAIAVANMQTDMDNEVVTVRVGALPDLIIGQGGLVEKGSKKYTHKGAKPGGSSAYISLAQFDLNKCTYKFTIKNMDLNQAGTPLLFRLTFAGFDQSQELIF